MAAGKGEYKLAIAGAILGFVVLSVMDSFDRWIDKHKHHDEHQNCQ